MQIKYLFNRKVFNKIQNIEEIDFAINAFLGYWNLQNKNETLIIELSSDELSDPDAEAGSRKENENTYVIHINKDFKGELHSLFTLLAHEIVHIKQLFKNEFTVTYFTNSNKEWDHQVFWKGKDVTHINPDKRPYEKEAVKYQTLMVDELYKEIDIIHSAIKK